MARGGAPPKPVTLQEIEAEYEKHESIFSEGSAIGNPDYWGKGFGREAVLLILDYGFRLRNLCRIWLTTISTNTRAVRCHEACGFVHEGAQRRHAYNNGRYVGMLNRGILREEWEARQPSR